MAFKQPKVPEYRENESTGEFLRKLILFLKDFSQDVWTAHRSVDKGIAGIRYPVTSVNGKTGDVELSAADVGARAGTWTPSAADVGALPKAGTAENSAKFDGKTWAQMLAAIYPVGAVYMSLNGTSPAYLFGGTWEQLVDRFLVGAGNRYYIGSAGGEEYHTLTVEEMPWHTHTWHSSNAGTNYPYGQNAAGAAAQYVGGTTNGLQWAGYNDYTGSSWGHNNMPPYLAVYMWRRVA